MSANSSPALLLSSARRQTANASSLYSSTLVSELRTSSLSPKKYYELYMAVFDALRHLSVFLRDSHPVNHLADLYELVQYAGTMLQDREGNSVATVGLPAER